MALSFTGSGVDSGAMAEPWPVLSAVVAKIATAIVRLSVVLSFAHSPVPQGSPDRVASRFLRQRSRTLEPPIMIAEQLEDRAFMAAFQHALGIWYRKDRKGKRGRLCGAEMISPRSRKSLASTAVGGVACQV